MKYTGTEDSTEFVSCDLPPLVMSFPCQPCSLCSTFSMSGRNKSYVGLRTVRGMPRYATGRDYRLNQVISVVFWVSYSVKLNGMKLLLPKFMDKPDIWE
jgi:hypothetical protein